MLRYLSLSLGQETDVTFPFCSSSESSTVSFPTQTPFCS